MSTFEFMVWNTHTLYNLPYGYMNFYRTFFHLASIAYQSKLPPHHWSSMQNHVIHTTSHREEGYSLLEALKLSSSKVFNVFRQWAISIEWCAYYCFLSWMLKCYLKTRNTLEIGIREFISLLSQLYTSRTCSMQHLNQAHYLFYHSIAGNMLISSILTWIIWPNFTKKGASTLLPRNESFD